MFKYSDCLLLFTWIIVVVLKQSKFSSRPKVVRLYTYL